MNSVFQNILLSSFIINLPNNVRLVQSFFNSLRLYIFYYNITRPKSTFLTIYKSMVSSSFTVLSLIPYIQKKIKDQIDPIKVNIINDINKNSEEINNIVEESGIVPNGLFKDSIESYRILELLKNLKSLDDSLVNKGKVSGAIYSDVNSKSIRFMNEIFPLYFKTNPLHPDIFPSLRMIEKWLIEISIELYNGDDNTRGSITSGGTESIFLACKAYRDLYNLKNPEIIAPITVHPAFDKACECLKIKLIKVPIVFSGEKYEESTLDLNYYKSKINSNTILLVASAPSFPHGEIDPIREIAEVGLEYNKPVHIDCCLGGFILPFLDYKDRIDFSIDGITSISADFHKYAYSPKGISIVMYKNKYFSDNQYFITDSWSGGIYATNTLLGSRPGNVIVMTWANMLNLGQRYYEITSKEIKFFTKNLAYSLNKIQGIRVIGNPENLLNVVAFTSDSHDIYSINEHLQKCGWNLNPLQFPSAIQLCITENHTTKEQHRPSGVGLAYNACGENILERC